MMTSTQHPTPLHFPFDAPVDAVPPSEFAHLRQDQPVAEVILPTGDRAWLVTRHADVCTVLTDSRFSRAAAESPSAPRLGPTRPGARTILGMDPPDHTRLRSMVMRAFTKRRIETLRPRVEEIAATQARLVQVAPRPVDLVSTYTLSVPIKVIFELMGVPIEDSDRLHAWSEVIFSLGGQSAERVAEARQNILDYLRGLIGLRRQRPTDDLLGQLVHERDDAGTLSEDELVEFAMILLAVGYQSTANSMATALFVLLSHPDQWARLREDFPASAVEELLRHNPYSLTGAQLRVATGEVELAGVTIAQGDGVLVALGSANRDEAVFKDPDVLDLTRRDNPHLAFGYGIHHCLGAQLARMEMQVGLSTLLRALPSEVRLAIPQEWVTWKSGLTARAPMNLPVVW